MFRSGDSIGPYVLIRHLGRGAFGEVWLAQKQTLITTTRVALKFPDENAVDLESVRNEAGLWVQASGHPNVLPILDADIYEGQIVIVSEYAGDGSLKQWLAQYREGRAPSVATALRMEVGILAGLQHLHSRRIIHRDLTPANILLQGETPRLADFGVSRVLKSSTQSMAARGTPAYMAPEAFDGVRSEQTDIWSAGVILYQLLSGELPFPHKDTTSLLAAITTKDPVPLVGTVPGGMKEIVSRALAKSPQERYESAAEVRAALQQVEKSVAAQPDVTPRLNNIKGDLSARSTLKAGNPPDGSPVIRRRGADRSLSFVANIIQNLNRRNVAIAAFLLLFLTAISVWWWRNSLRNSPTPNESRLTFTGKVTDATVSPDGRRVIYLVDDGGQESLRIRQVHSGEDVQLVPPADNTYQALTFSPDGDYVYVARYEGESGVSVLYQISTLSGSQTKLMEDIDSAITFSPDGKKIAFLRISASKGEDSLIVANADGTQEKILDARERPRFFRERSSLFHFLRPSWSPDGKSIACAAGSYSYNYMSVLAVQVENGAEIPVTSARWASVGQVEWLKDGSGLVLTAREQASSPLQVWFVNVGSGERRRITNDTGEYTDVSLASGSNALAAIKTEYSASIWVQKRGETNSSQRLDVAGNYNGSVSWTPDGKIIYDSKESGNWEIWMMNADGGHKQRLTFEGEANRFPSVSRDSRYIIFVSVHHGAGSIWRMDSDGRNINQLTTGNRDTFPQPSSEGWVVYAPYSSDKVALWRVPIEGGDASQLTNRLSTWPAISPDGNLIACAYRENPSSACEIGVLELNGELREKLDVPPSALVPGPLSWSGASEISYVETVNGIGNIWGQPLTGARAHPLTDYKSDQIFYFNWSRDGKLLACSRGSETSDVFLISNFR